MTLPVYIGFDPREATAFHVLAHSLCARSSRPLAITPLVLNQLPLNRKRDHNQSTEFSFSRFLVPWLSGYRGWSLYLDCDMLCKANIVELFELTRLYDDTANNQKAVLVVKHDYGPKEETKFLGERQTSYEKKNWSSVMLFNNSLCVTLTPNYVNTASGLDLHQFRWLGSEGLIGELPARWNHLVGHSKNENPSIVHWTDGGPWFSGFANSEYSDEWRECAESVRRLAGETVE